VVHTSASHGRVPEISADSSRVSLGWLSICENLDPDEFLDGIRLFFSQHRESVYEYGHGTGRAWTIRRGRLVSTDGDLRRVPRLRLQQLLHHPRGHLARLRGSAALV
jgi:hypothetical protein